MEMIPGRNMQTALIRTAKKFFEYQHSLHAFTLVESLVTMLVTGILLLVVMDGLTLFFGLQVQQMEKLITASTMREGYVRMEQLLASADSITAGDCDFQGNISMLQLWRANRCTRIVFRDSALLFETIGFSDTLLRDVMSLYLTSDSIRNKTVTVGFRTGFIHCFPVMAPTEKLYQKNIEEIETGHGYKKK